MAKNLLIVFLFVVGKTYSQCTLNTVLNTSGNCTGATLSVAAADSLSKIIWYNGSRAIDSAVAVDTATSGITVAGGNGMGLARNQFGGYIFFFVTQAGDVYVSDANNYRILKFPAGSSSATFGTVVAGGSYGGMYGGSAANQLSPPSCIFVDDAGNLYVADGGNSRIQKFPPGSDSTTNGVTVAGIDGQGSAPNQFNSPGGIWVDKSGTLYIIDGNNLRIQKWLAGAIAGTTWISGLDPGSGGPLFMDSEGNLFIEEGFDRVLKFSPNARSLSDGVIVAGGHGQGAAANQLDEPQGVYVDSAGNVYVADWGNHRIQKWAPGSISGITVAGGNGAGSAANQFHYVTGVSIDANGDLFIADEDNRRIQKWALSGSIRKSHLADSSGVYTAVVTNKNGCTVTSNPITIDQRIPTRFEIIPSAKSICKGAPLSFTAVSANTLASPFYDWKVNGTGTGYNNPVYTNSNLSDGDIVNCIITGGSTCQYLSSDSIVVIVSQTPVVPPGQSYWVQKGQSITLDPVITGDIQEYHWSPGTGLSDTSIKNPLADPATTIIYTLDVVSFKGCPANGTIVVNVSSSIGMPNAFTPNGDGLNDVFYVSHGQQGDRIKDFSIYNRWGLKVFGVQNAEPGDPFSGWNGYAQGSPAPAGTYVYLINIISADGRAQTLKGTVVLVR